MAKPKQTKISFRLDDVRSYKMTEYQSENKIKRRKDGIMVEDPMNNTEFMIKAIDNLLYGENSNLMEEIKKYEQTVIKIISGFSRKDFETKEEYLEKLKERIKDIEKAIKDKK